MRKQQCYAAKLAQAHRWYQRGKVGGVNSGITAAVSNVIRGGASGGMQPAEWVLNPGPEEDEVDAGRV